MRRLLPLLLLLLPVVLAADILVAPPPVGAAAGERYMPHAARNGDGFLVVWQDVRGSRSEYRAIRVSRDGVPIDRTDFSLGAERPFDWILMASDGRDTLVLFSRLGATSVVIVTSDGQVIRRPDLPDWVRDVAFARDRYVVARGNGALAFMNTRGDVTRGYIGFGRRSEQIRNIRLAAAPDGRLLIVWRTLGGPFTAVIDVDLLAAPSFTGFDSGSSATPSPDIIGAATNGDTFLVAWRERVGDVSHFRTRALDRDGRPLGPDRTAGVTFSFNAVALAPSGSGYVLSTIDSFSLEYALLHLDSAGVPRGTTPLLGRNGASYYLDLAGDGGSLLAVWVQRTGGLGGTLVAAAGIDESGDFTHPPSLISRNYLGQRQSAATRCDDGWLMAWTELGPYAEVRYRRFSPEGRALDPLSLPAGSSPRRDQSRPAVACGGGTHLVVWTESRPAENGTSLPGAVYGTLLGGAEPVVFQIRAGGWDETQSSAVWDGRSYVTATIEYSTVVVERWDHRGRATGDRFVYGPHYGLRTASAIAAIDWNGSEFLVAFREAGTHADGLRIRTIRLDRALQLLSMEDLTGWRGTTTVFPSIDVAASPDRWMVVWSEGSNLPITTARPYRHIAYELARDGSPAFGAQIIADQVTEPQADVAWDGEAFLFAAGHVASRIVPGGRAELVAGPVGADVEAVAVDGARRLILYTRDDEGTDRLWMRLDEVPR